MPTCFSPAIVSENFSACLFLGQFFCQYHLFASSAQRVNKAQSYNSKVGWPYAAQCSCLIGSRRVTDSCRRVPIGFVRFPNEVTWRSNGRRLDLLTWRANLAEVCSHNSNSYQRTNKVESFKPTRLCRVFEKSTLSRVDSGDLTPAMDCVNFAG